MALLTVNERKAIFKQLGFGEYNEKSIKAFQKKYMLRKSDYDGVYGPNTDNTLRTVFYTLKYTKNFKPEEFRCECHGKYCCGYPSYMKPAELIHIQAIRDHWKKPITVTCGLRCKTWNSKLGGSIQNSLHMQGLAIDFYQQGVTDTLANRKSSIKWIKKQPNHHYTYGNGINSYGSGVYAPYMGNALHTDTNDNVKPIHPEWKEPAKPITNKIASLANEYAYSTNAKEANYKGGVPTAAYSIGLDKAYPDRSKWGTAARRGASCDVLVGVCVRNSGVDKNFPRGLKEQIPYLANSSKFEKVSVTTSTAKDGDIIVYTKKSGGGHICIVCSGKIKEAGHESYYPKTTDYLKERLSTSGKNWVKVYRAVEENVEPKPEPAPEPVVPKKTVDEIAKEIIDGKGDWGNGDERKKRLTEAGYDYDAVQKKVNDILESQTSWVDRANAWAKKIAADNSYHYVKWAGKDAKTHECPICHNHAKGKYHGWNCIGFSFAVLHHGAGLPSKCSNGVIANNIWENILNAKTDAEALAIARKHVGLKDLKVIRNKKGIPKKEWKAGDICGKFNGEKYIHTFYYMGDGKIAESTGSSGKVPNDNQIRIKDYKNTSAKVIVRYIGK